MAETISLASARIEVEERPGYLYMVEHGTLRTVDEVSQYAAAMELLAERTRIRRAVIDSRDNDAIEPPREVRDAMWRWLVGGKAFEQIAFVLRDPMAVARVNMTALSQRANLKAFEAVHEAHRWLTGRQRTQSQAFQAITGSIAPPPGTPPPPRPSTPPPPADLSSRATARSGEITIAPAPLPGSASRNTGRFDAVRPPSTPAIPATRRSDVIPAIPGSDAATGDGSKPDKT